MNIFALLAPTLNLLGIIIVIFLIGNAVVDFNRGDPFMAYLWGTFFILCLIAVPIGKYLDKKVEKAEKEAKRKREEENRRYSEQSKKYVDRFLATRGKEKEQAAEDLRRFDEEWERSKKAQQATEESSIVTIDNEDCPEL